jgi:hypothetical protein
MAATSHMTKAGTRLLINTSPEPFTNWSASLTGDFLVFSGMWTALKHPEIFLLLLVVFIGIAIWLLPKLWRLIKVMFSKIGKFLGLVKAEPVTSGESETLIPMQKHRQLSTLERLQQLRDKGALTEREFEQQKEIILKEGNH